jgi:hypothetical protein
LARPETAIAIVGKPSKSGAEEGALMNDQFGYIAYGTDELYHRGALFSALRLWRYCPDAKITVLTDKPEMFDRYPIDTIMLTENQKAEMSFGHRYHFGIKAAGSIELLKRCDRLLFMDTDMYAAGDISRAFDRISAKHSIMRMCEGAPRGDYAKLANAGVSLGDQVLSGSEPMWNSGILGLHRENLPALGLAYSAIERVSEIIKMHTPEQFCIGVALTQDGRTISPHALPIHNYSTSGKKRFARQQIERFFAIHSASAIDQQIETASRVRLWRGPMTFLSQKILRH